MLGVSRADASSETVCLDCGHKASLHRHFRSGSDCGACDCQQFRFQARPGADLWHRLRDAARRRG
jgi:hypothetical protein